MMEVMLEFSGKELVRSEADASSFPSDAADDCAPPQPETESISITTNINTIHILIVSLLKVDLFSYCNNYPELLQTVYEKTTTS